MAYPQGGHDGGYGGYQQQPGYGYPGYGYPPPGPPRFEHPQGTTVIVLGALSLLSCGICGPFAWSMGTKALAEIDLDPMRYSNRELVNLGRILGIVGTVLLGAQILFGLLPFLFFFVILGGTAASGG
jgi:hypothetical protein